MLGGDSETFHQYTSLPTSNNLENSESGFDPVDLVTETYNNDTFKLNGVTLTASDR